MNIGDFELKYFIRGYQLLPSLGIWTLIEVLPIFSIGEVGKNPTTQDSPAWSQVHGKMPSVLPMNPRISPEDVAEALGFEK